MGIQEIKDNLPIKTYLASVGIELHGDSCPCPIHGGRNHNFFVYDNRTWTCFSKKCGTGADVIDLHMALTGLSMADAIKDLSNKFGIEDGNIKVKPDVWHTVKKYTHLGYVDGRWKEIVSSIRQSNEDGTKKKFFQKRPDGGRVNMLRNIPFYRYEEWCNSKYVFFVEGHKDVETLEWLGFKATCNLAGAGKLKNHNLNQFYGKKVIIFYDNDMAGYEHAVTVLVALTGIASEVRIIHLSGQGEKDDVSDYVRRLYDAGQNKKQIKDSIIYAIKNQEIVIDKIMRSRLSSNDS